jgi:hypothetical protein
VILVSSAVLAADCPGLSETHPHHTPEKVIYTLGWDAVDTQVMQVLRRPPRRASGYPEGEPLASEAPQSAHSLQRLAPRGAFLISAIPLGWVQIANRHYYRHADHRPRRRGTRSASATGGRVVSRSYCSPCWGVALILAAFRVDVPMLTGASPVTWHGWMHGPHFC